MKENRLPIRMERNVEHPRLAAGESVAVTYHVEEDFHDAESKESADQSRQRQEHQVDEMAPVGTNEGPRANREAEDVARAELARLRKCNFTRSWRCEDGC